MQSDQDHLERDQGLPSKSQVKREMQALREMASALGQLSSDRVHSLPASAEFREGVLALKQLAEGEPRKRQIHYLGRRLLEEDEQALQRELDSQQSGTTENARRLHMAERWRERLLDGASPPSPPLLRRSRKRIASICDNWSVKRQSRRAARTTETAPNVAFTDTYANRLTKPSARAIRDRCRK